MSDFKASEYFQRKVDSVGERTISQVEESLVAARERKVQELTAFSNAAREGRVLWGAPRTAGEIAGDIGVTAAKGIVALPQAYVGLADIPARGRVGKRLEQMGIRFDDAQKILDDLYSDSQKDANYRVQSAEGFWGTVDAALENPSTIAAAVGESIPQMLGGAAVARKILGFGAKTLGAGLAGPTLPGVLTRTVGEKLAPVLAGAAGEDVIGAGAAASQIREQTADGLLTPEQSLAAVGSGLGTAAVGLVGGKIAQKLSLPDIDTALASGGFKAGITKPAGFIKALVGSGISEGALEEMPQSMQEQIWQNFALQKPLLEGVPEAGAMGLLTGAAMGGTAGGVSALASGDGAQKQAMNDSASRDALVAEAAKTGNVAGLLDPKSAAYAPKDAVLALLANAKQAGTSEAQKEANLTKAQEVVSQLKRVRAAAQDELTLQSPEGIQAKISEVQAALDSAPDTDKPLYQESLAMLQEQQTELAQNTDRLGFLVQFATPVMKQLTKHAWSYSWSSLYIEWVYADTLEEAIEKGKTWAAEMKALGTKCVFQRSRAALSV